MNRAPRSVAAGCWLLAAGCWLLAAGCWLLAAGCWLLAGCTLSVHARPSFGLGAHQGLEAASPPGVARVDDITCMTSVSGSAERRSRKPAALSTDMLLTADVIAVQRNPPCVAYERLRRVVLALSQL